MSEAEILCEAAGLIAEGYHGTMAFAIWEVATPDDRMNERAQVALARAYWFTPDGINNEWKILTLLTAAMEALPK